MKGIITVTILCYMSSQFISAQNYGDFPKLSKEKLLNDLELLYQGLDKFHSGMYWYTPKSSVDNAFEKARAKIDNDLNVLEFHKLIAPLVALSQENHTTINFPESVSEKIKKEVTFFPLTVVFLGERMYCVKNGSGFQDIPLEGREIESINGESPVEIVDKIGQLLVSDGFIKTVKYSDMEGISFAWHYFNYYGEIEQFFIKLKDRIETITLKSLKIEDFNRNYSTKYSGEKKKDKHDLLEYKILSDSTAYLGVHSFSNSDLKDYSKEKNLKSFLKKSFKSMEDNQIKTLIIDVSENNGGTEGNEGLLYSYLGENYQKYKEVRVKTQKAVLDNGIDKPIKLKAFGFWERLLLNKKMKDGSFIRRQWLGHGLMAYKKEPKYKFKGKVYVIISPVTYSGGSEFCNMMYTNDLATFVGQETGGGYFGNTSGYQESLVLPNSEIEISIPALQFVMNVKPKLPFGRGVLPHFKVIPSIEQYLNGENASLSYILDVIEK